MEGKDLKREGSESICYETLRYLDGHGVKMMAK